MFGIIWLSNTLKILFNCLRNSLINVTAKALDMSKMHCSTMPAKSLQLKYYAVFFFLFVIL